jgi:hypothetical protein
VLRSGRLLSGHQHFLLDRNSLLSSKVILEEAKSFFSKQKDGGPLPITRPSLSRGSGNLFFENVLSTCFIQNKGLENLMHWYKTAHERHRGPGCFFLSRGSAALPAHVREHSGVRDPPPHARSPLDDATADFSIAIATIKEGDEEPYGSTNII